MQLPWLWKSIKVTRDAVRLQMRVTQTDSHFKWWTRVTKHFGKVSPKRPSLDVLKCCNKEIGNEKLTGLESKSVLIPLTVLLQSEGTSASPSNCYSISYCLKTAISHICPFGVSSCVHLYSSPFKWPRTMDKVSKELLKHDINSLVVLYLSFPA